MSIFQDSFPSYVDRQLQIREAILKHGNTNNRFGSPNLKLKDGKVRIKPGAFYTNTVERQCTIRMSSGVDIKGLSDPAELFVLEGGVPKKEGGQREGFTTGNRKSNVYGSKEIFSDAGDDFGIVPMPGIIDANIRTKSAYGSLREAQVNFVCHNRRQLEILERLYMRPGFPLLVEWQWSPYIDNDGNTQKRVKTLSNKGGMFWDKSSTYEKMQQNIHKLKKQSGGNYDGFLGICKNFDFKATPAGGYECTTEIVSTGEVIDGIKGKRSGFKIRVEGEEEERELDNFEYFLEAIKQYSEVFTLQNEEKTKKTNDIFKANASLFQSFQKLANNVNPDGVRLFEAISDDQLEELRNKEKIAKVGEETAEKVVGAMHFKHAYNPIDYYQANEAKARTKEGKDFQAEIARIEGLLDKFIIRKGEVVSVNDIKNDVAREVLKEYSLASPPELAATQVNPPLESSYDKR